ncbi:unnamed protein product [Lota lota]
MASVRGLRREGHQGAELTVMLAWFPQQPSRAVRACAAWLRRVHTTPNSRTTLVQPTPPGAQRGPRLLTDEISAKVIPRIHRMGGRARGRGKGNRDPCLGLCLRGPSATVSLAMASRGRYGAAPLLTSEETETDRIEWDTPQHRGEQP